MDPTSGVTTKEAAPATGPRSGKWNTAMETIASGYGYNDVLSFVQQILHCHTVEHWNKRAATFGYDSAMECFWCYEIFQIAALSRTPVQSFLHSIQFAAAPANAAAVMAATIDFRVAKPFIDAGLAGGFKDPLSFLIAHCAHLLGREVNMVIQEANRHGILPAQFAYQQWIVSRAAASNPATTAAPSSTAATTNGPGADKWNRKMEKIASDGEYDDVLSFVKKRLCFDTVEEWNTVAATLGYGNPAKCVKFIRAYFRTETIAEDSGFETVGSFLHAMNFASKPECSSTTTKHYHVAKDFIDALWNADSKDPADFVLARCSSLLGKEENTVIAEARRHPDLDSDDHPGFYAATLLFAAINLATAAPSSTLVGFEDDDEEQDEDDDEDVDTSHAKQVVFSPRKTRSRAKGRTATAKTAKGKEMENRPSTPNRKDPPAPTAATKKGAAKNSATKKGPSKPNKKVLEARARVLAERKAQGLPP